MVISPIYFTLLQKFLMVYQSAWMSALMVRYGNDIVMLDATYKTSRFSLPLFFLAVKTNVDHQVVAAFITEQETTVAITEALSIIRDSNPSWSPSVFMTDLDEKEINAIEQLFPGNNYRGGHCVFI